MGIAAAADDKNVAQGKAIVGLKPKVRRRLIVLQHPPSPLYYTFILIVCIILGEVFEEFVVRHMAPHFSQVGWYFFDIFSMTVVIVPSFYFFAYRPMKRHSQEKAAAEEEIKFLSRQLILLGDREKTAVARDLHDQFGQSLTHLQFSMENLKATFSEKQSSQQAQCEDLVDSITRLGDMVRNVATRLSPPQLEDLGLESTIEWAVKDIVNY